MARKLSTQDVEVQPPTSTPASRAALKTSAAKPPKMRAQRPKPAEPPKAAIVVERVPAVEAIALITELGLTKTAFGLAIGKSASTVSEYVGAGRGKLAKRSSWVAYEKAARAAKVVK